MTVTLEQSIENNSQIDLLNRQEFVDRILQVAEALSQNKRNACYAVNGAWGTGKSFVMDMFEKQAKDVGQEGTTLSRFLVFHYNCWEYDYYEEPLIAIVITMLDAIDRSVKLIDAETKTKVKEVLKTVAKGLGKKVVATIEEKTGVEIQKAIDIVSDGLQNAEKELQNDFDPYRDFKHALHQLRDEVTSLAKEQTVIFVVDELDRCLPEYAIKVLERLHHLFNGISNVQVILSIDKKQLEHTVRQIYGPEADVSKYLEKFINFELHLDVGSFNEQDKLQQAFQTYFEQFDYIFSETKADDVQEFCQIVFENVDIRARLAIINKCMLLHDLLGKSGEQYDYSFMCIEILLTLIKYLNVSTNYPHTALSGKEVHFYLPAAERPYPSVMDKLSQKYASDTYWGYKETDYGMKCIVLGTSLWGIVLSSYCTIMGEDFFFSGHYGNMNFDYNPQSIVNYTKDYWALVNAVC